MWVAVVGRRPHKQLFCSPSLPEPHLHTAEHLSIASALPKRELLAYQR